MRTSPLATLIVSASLIAGCCGSPEVGCGPRNFSPPQIPTEAGRRDLEQLVRVMPGIFQEELREQGSASSVRVSITPLSPVRGPKTWFFFFVEHTRDGKAFRQRFYVFHEANGEFKAMQYAVKGDGARETQELSKPQPFAGYPFADMRPLGSCPMRVVRVGNSLEATATFCQPYNDVPEVRFSIETTVMTVSPTHFTQRIATRTDKGHPVGWASGEYRLRRVTARVAQ